MEYEMSNKIEDILDQASQITDQYNQDPVLPRDRESKPALEKPGWSGRQTIYVCKESTIFFHIGDYRLCSQSNAGPEGPHTDQKLSDNLAVIIGSEMTVVQALQSLHVLMEYIEYDGLDTIEENHEEVQDEDDNDLD
jgi:hypothetical protein